MKAMKRFAPLALMAAAALVGFALRQDEQLIRLKIEDGRVDRYRVEIDSAMKMNAAGLGEQDFGLKASMDTSYAYGAPGAEGKADVEVKTTNMKMEASGAAEMMMGNQELPKEFAVKGKMDSRYRLTEAKTTGLNAQTQMMMGMGGASSMSMLFELPEKPVKIGDTWPVFMPKNPILGDKAHELVAKLVALKDADGAAVYEVQISGKVDLDVNMSEAFKKVSDPNAENPLAMLGEMTMKGTLDVSGTALVNRKDGHLMRNETKVAAKQTLSVGGINADVNGVTTVKMVLAK